MIEQSRIGKTINGKIIVATELPYVFNLEDDDGAVGLLIGSNVRKILEYFMKHPRRLIPEQEFERYVWPNYPRRELAEVVGPDRALNLSTGISILYEKLGYLTSIQESYNILTEVSLEKPRCGTAFQFNADVADIVPGSETARVVEARILEFKEETSENNVARQFDVVARALNRETKALLNEGRTPQDIEAVRGLITEYRQTHPVPHRT